MIIEDGGYLNPQINRRLLLKNNQKPTNVEQLVRLFGLDYSLLEGYVKIPSSALLEEVLQIWAGGVEHTRNGWDANYDVATDNEGSLARPLISIALSYTKAKT